MSTWLHADQAFTGGEHRDDYADRQRRERLAHIRALIRDGKIIHGPDGSLTYSPEYHEALYGRACADTECTERFHPSRATQKYCSPRCRRRTMNREYNHRVAHGIPVQPKSGICVKHNVPRRLITIRSGVTAGKRYYACPECRAQAVQRGRAKRSAERAAA